MSSKPRSPDDLGAGDAMAGAGPGWLLREAREALGLSVEEAAGKLHLAVTTVRALEADDYAGLPPAIFVRGYLKNMARLLDLDPKVVIAAYERQDGREAMADTLQLTPFDPGSGESRFGFLLISLTLIAFLGLGWWVYQTSGDRAETSEVAVTPQEIVPEMQRPAPLEETMEVGATSAALPAAIPAVGGVPAMGSPASAEPRTAAPEPSDVPSIRVRFLGDSWISVLDADGNRLLYELGAKGAERLVRGKPPFAVVLGRPAEISLEYKDQPYNHGYTDNRAPARFVIAP